MDRARSQARTDRRRTAALATLGALLLTGVWAVHGVVDLAWHNRTYVVLNAALLTVCLAAATLLWRRARRRDLVIVLAVALAARALVAFDMPTLSDDVYRFVWDGRVQAHAINPYRYPPAAPRLRALRDYEIFTQVNRPLTLTGYPPANELVFAGVNRVAGEGVVQVKLALLACEALAVMLLLALLARAGLSRGRVALYAWHPLAIVEVAGSGHPEPLLAVFTLTALLAWDRRRPLRAGAALGAAALTKLVPLLIAPFMLRRLGARFAAAAFVAAALLLAPYAGAGTAAFGSLGAYRREHFGAGPYDWLTGLGLGGSTVRALLTAALALAVAYTAARPPRDLARACSYAALLFGGALLASFNVQPWYLLWVLPLLCVAPLPGLLWACCTASAYYLAFGPNKAISQATASAIVWAPAVLLLAAGAVRSRLERSATGAPPQSQPVPVPWG